ncbi:Uncharacterised protein [Candidatus Gugararchaeum adminiculabundum]|nr:Uncharacterised protein [Candidatus Gugararchaeum adminiculabundum]
MGSAVREVKLRLMIPEAAYIRKENTVRDMQLPGDVLMTKRSIMRWLALALGLVSPKESRQLMLYVFESLVNFHLKKKSPDIHEIVAQVKKSTGKKSSENEETLTKAVRYHLNYLQKQGIIEREKGAYRFVVPSMSEDDDLASCLEQAYVNNVNSAFQKIKKALKAYE